MELRKLGPYVFLVGFVIALLVGIVGGGLDASTTAFLYLVLAVLGLIVGFTNISDKETVPFLIAIIAIVQLQSLPDTLDSFKSVPELVPVVNFVDVVVGALVVFLLPAALVVALKAIYDLAGEGAFQKVEKTMIGKKRR